MDVKPVLTKYGTENFARLRKVLLHQPVSSLKLINGDNYKSFLFDKCPDIDSFLAEHQNYQQLLKEQGVDVLELSDYVVKNRDLMNELPNLTYMHDSSVITHRGAILSKMSFPGRKGEDLVVKEALQNLGVPIFHEFAEGDEFEGCLFLSPETLIMANTERHSKKSIDKFIPIALKLFKEIIYLEIPQERRFMHPDTIFNRISSNLALVYLPAILKAYLITSREKQVISDFKKFMMKREIELINISEEEQKRWGCTFVPLDQNVIIHYDISLNTQTKRELNKRGVEIIEFHPQALLAGGGSLRCLTLRLLRDEETS